mmetsp:Transcript_64146/g.118165  ORF Transcript_64146/g.118165 Transcript_64146/m.118165 type:complete len:300 (+) Transcript_64146:86-985(+)
MATLSLLLLAWAVLAGPSGCEAKLLLKMKDTNFTSASLMNTSESLQDSFGLINEPEELWELRKQVHLAQMQREANIPSNYYNQSGEIWWQYHHEPSFHCTLAERLGHVGDGGKWVCDPYSMKKNIDSGKPCLVYSIGSNGQFDFEKSVQDLISPRCEVHIFDPAKVGTWPVPANMSYHAYPLGSGTEVVQGVRTKSFPDIVQELGHKGRTIDILKIDCEGCEWQTVTQWLTSGVEIRQILVELHWDGVKDGDKANEFYKFLYKHGYAVFNKEPNTEAVGQGGFCIEYSFLKLGPGFSKP